MSLTRAAVEGILLVRVGPRLAMPEVGLTITPDPATGRVECLTGPLLEGLRAAGVGPADPLDVTDADLAGVAAAAVPRLLDLAELRALEDALGRWTEPDQTAGPSNSYSLGSLYAAFEKTVERKRAEVQRRYGVGLSSPVGGRLDLDFQQRSRWPTGYWPCP